MLLGLKQVLRPLNKTALAGGQVLYPGLAALAAWDGCAGNMQTKHEITKAALLIVLRTLNLCVRRLHVVQTCKDI